MPNIRIDRISEEVRKALSEILRDIKDPGMAPMVSILGCEVTRDMRYAKVRVSVMGEEELQKSTMAALKRAAGFIRRELGARVSLRAVPEPVFTLDTSIAYSIHIAQVLEQINAEGKDEGGR